MQLDEAGTLATFKARRSEIFLPLVSNRGSRIVQLDWTVSVEPSAGWIGAIR